MPGCPVPFCAVAKSASELSTSGTEKAAVDETILQVRQLATDLRPVILDFGLQAAIEWQAHEFQTRSGIACVVDASAEPGFLSPKQETGVFRVFQESLTNIARHAGASLVKVTLRQSPNGFHLDVAANGPGTPESWTSVRVGISPSHQS